MLGRRGLILLSMTILLSCNGKSLDAVTGDSGATSGSAGGTSGSAGGTSGSAGGDHGSGGADAGNDTASVADAALDLPKDTGSCPPSSGGISSSSCTAANLGLMCMFTTDTGNYSCTCSPGDLITVWRCTMIP
jgi:hypothetical protein